MKKMKKVTVLVLSMILCCMALWACNAEPSTEGGAQQANQQASGNVTYKVSVKDAKGTPYTSGVVVKFMQNGVQMGLQVVNAEGVAEKALPSGDYAVELQFTDSEINYVYNKGMQVTAAQPSAEAVVNFSLGSQSQSLYVEDREYEAVYLTTGCTAITLDPAKMTYFLFAPTEAGAYEFSLIGSDAAIGYYGAPHFVQTASAAEVENNAFTMSIRKDMIGTGDTGTTILVLGVAAGEGEAVFSIERIGDPQWTVSDEPWTVYEATGPMTAYTHNAKAKLTDFDLKAQNYTLVLGEDGFYHKDTADGPLVLVRLGKESGGSEYLDDFQTILEHSGVSKYFYDANGEFVKKEKYDDCLIKYFEIMDEETGLYPLTEDLKYIIQSRGEYSGWFEPSNGLYLFKDENGNPIPGINNEISWLFMCCIAE